MPASAEALELSTKFVRIFKLSPSSFTTNYMDFHLHDLQSILNTHKSSGMGSLLSVADEGPDEAVVV